MTDFQCEEAAAAHGCATVCTTDDHDRNRWLTWRDRRGRSWTVCVGQKLALIRAERKAKRESD
jgi:hypothetical protein